MRWECSYFCVEPLAVPHIRSHWSLWTLLPARVRREDTNSYKLCLTHIETRSDLQFSSHEARAQARKRSRILDTRVTQGTNCPPFMSMLLLFVVCLLLDIILPPALHCIHFFVNLSPTLSVFFSVCVWVWTRKHWSTRWKRKNHLHLVMSRDDAATGDTESKREKEKKSSLHASNSQGHWNLDLNCMDDVFHRTMRQEGRKRWSDYSLILFSSLLSSFFSIGRALCHRSLHQHTHCTSSLF